MTDFDPLTGARIRNDETPVPGLIQQQPTPQPKPSAGDNWVFRAVVGGAIGLGLWWLLVGFGGFNQTCTTSSDYNPTTGAGTTQTTCQ